MEAQLARKTRVVLIDMSVLLRGIVRGVLAPAPDVELVGEFPESTELAAAVEETDADVVVLDALGEGGSVRRLLETHPRVRVLAIAADGRRGTIFLLAPEREALGEISPEVLLEAVRRETDWSALPDGAGA